MFGQTCPQAGAVHIAHREEELAVVVTDFKDRNYSRVLQSTSCFSLDAESASLLWRRESSSGHPLEGNHAIESGSPRLVDDSHPSRGDPFEEHIIRELPMR